MKNLPLLTILTPTYNRVLELTRVYESLIVQSSKNFKWMIIDDGSIDSTESVVAQWIHEGIIPISYKKQINSGKVRTMNVGIKEAETALWLCLDSDDWLNSNAVQIIENEYQKIKDDSLLCGMIGLRYTSNEKTMQNKIIPIEFDKVNYQTLRYKLKIAPEYVEIFKTDILKKYLYPEIQNEKYFPLSYLHDQLSQKYDFLVLHQPVMYIEYQDSGMTKKRTELILKNPIGYMLFKKQLLELAPTFKIAIVSAVTYNSATILAHDRPTINTLRGKVLTYLTYPLGVIDYLVRFKWKYNIHLEKTYE
ncbi:glycosyltransferase family A protein [Marinilactibacillus psychrotolerans]|nr:glycosyltransferase family A protein [Marinilactibacillus psychrotolerans]